MGTKNEYIQQSNEKRKPKQKRGPFITHSSILAAVKNVKRPSLGQRERNIFKVRRAEPSPHCGSFPVLRVSGYATLLSSRNTQDENKKTLEWPASI